MITVCIHPRRVRSTDYDLVGSLPVRSAYDSTGMIQKRARQLSASASKNNTGDISLSQINCTAAGKAPPELSCFRSLILKRGDVVVAQLSTAADLGSSPRASRKADVTLENEMQQLQRIVPLS